LVRQQTGTVTLDFQYDSSGTAVGFKHNSATSYFYLRNLQGDVVGIANTSGTVVVNYTYDAWGNIISVTGSSAGTIGAQNPLRYRGYLYDEETKYYFCETRYYSPGWRRFINVDALFVAGDSLNAANMYAYCDNNPVMKVDPSGMADTYNNVDPAVGPIMALLMVGLLIIGGVLAIGIGKAVSDAIKNGSFNWNLKDSQRKHIVDGSKNHGGHNWKPFGIDGWPALVALLTKVLTNPDRIVGPKEVDGGRLWYFYKDFPKLDLTVVVKVFQSIAGVFKLSDAWTIPFKK